jgi:hypothetical protein
MTRTSATPAPCVNRPEPAATAEFPEAFRLLNWNEVVSRGDFVRNAQRGFELWDGPAGFQADSFLEPIYRKRKNGSPTTKSSK